MTTARLRWSLPVVVGLLLAALVIPANASAAKLTLIGGQRAFATTMARCTDSTVTVSPVESGSTAGTGTTVAQVAVSGIVPRSGATCTVGAVKVYSTISPSSLLYSGDGSVSGTVLTTATVDGTTFTPPPTATGRVYVTINGWPVAATWTYTPAIWCTVISGGSSGATCAATVKVANEKKTGGASYATYYDVVVQTTSTKALTWEVGFNLLSSFYGGVPTRLGNSTLDGYSDDLTTWDGTPANNVTTQGTCSAGQLRVRGTSAGPAKNKFETVSSARQRQFSLVADAPLAGFNDVLAAGCP